jgi:hypothetical protein
MGGGQDWAHNIYRQPERMGEIPAEAYRMQPDIYSLGVCLLEIGLWEPLVKYSHASPNDGGGDRSAEPTPSYGRVCHDFVTTKRPWIFFKSHLVALAWAELPRRMGDPYTAVVVTCLNCLDGDSEYFGEDEAEEDAALPAAAVAAAVAADKDGIIVGVRFIEAVFGQLSQIVL